MTSVDIDHIVLACADLDRAERVFTDRLDIRCRGGGAHEGIGTRNRIVPLGSTYLELVTVDDPRAAARHPFGRLVKEAIDRKRLFAGWVVEGCPGPDEVRIERCGVSIRLGGCSRALTRPDLPMVLERPAGQLRPGESGAAGRLVELEVGGPAAAAAGAPPAGVVVRSGRSVGIVSCTVLTAGGDRVRIDEGWEVR